MKTIASLYSVVGLMLGLIATVAVSVSPIAHLASAQSNSSSTASKVLIPPKLAVQVQAGGGNTTLPYDIFTPKLVHINSGQSVSWYNPAKVAEPHTVTFVMDNKTKAPLSSPFLVKNTTSFASVPPGSNSAPVILPNPKNQSMTMILGSNTRASNPVVIDSTGKVTHLPPNPTYSVKGDEKFINSGLLFPKGKGPPNASTSFTLKFEAAGTYNYYCILHPWMKGKVMVS
jgi:plastocyanin